jgi:hypothetical protein
MHYISVVAFRHRSDGGQPILKDFRKVVYIDLEPPAFDFIEPVGPIGVPSYSFTAKALDRTIVRMHMIVNAPIGVDPVTLCDSTNIASQPDRFDFSRTITLSPGTYSLTIVAFEENGRSAWERYENIVISIGSGDVNGDGVRTIDDLYDAYRITGYNAALDMNQNSVNDPQDFRLLEAVLRPTELRLMSQPQR